MRVIRSKVLGLAVGFSLLASLPSCNAEGHGGKGGKVAVLNEELTDQEIHALEGTRVFFGHQSVGRNILDGVADILSERGIATLKILEFPSTQKAQAFVGIAHGAVGRNRSPQSKLRDFASRVSELAGSGLDLALLKFCYVDVDEATDVDRLFVQYSETIAELQAAHPAVRFVHVTIPLSHVRGDWKALVKRLIGRSDREDHRNALREAYNARLRRAYGGREPLFDLAMIESTLPDGKRATYRYQGKELPMLAREYTDDFEHLNQRGRKIVASRLLALLSREGR